MNFHYEGICSCFPVGLEVEQALGEPIEAGEAIGSQDVSMHDGEIDLDLAEPTSVYGAMDERQTREPLFESEDRSPSLVRTPVINDPEDATSVVAGRASHDLFHQTIKGSNAGSRFATTKDPGVMNIKSGDVGPGAAAIIFVFDDALIPGSIR